MGLKSNLAKPFASWVIKKRRRWETDPITTQLKVFQHLITSARTTQFGKDHQFAGILDHQDFKAQVPIRDYEALTNYIERILKGENDILWPGQPVYFAKTSGTTSGTKYIPITKASISNHIHGARDALLSYIQETGKSQFVDGKLIFLSGSPILEEKEGIHIGRLSGIVNHHIPGYLKRNQVPSYATNCIEDWEAKVEKIIEETLYEDMTLISGIPPWVQMYFDRLQATTGKYIKDIFPNFSLFVHGGVNFQPYSEKLYESIGRPIDSIETYPASEGFIAYQDSQEAEGLLLLLDSGIFFEFIPMDSYFAESPTRLTIGEIELGQQYAVVINSNAGLWGYSLGDTVKFVSKDPYRIVVTGRIKHFISAFGEHVIVEEVEKAMQETLLRYKEASLVEFTVAPQVNPDRGLPLHQWLVEFEQSPNNLSAFEKDLNLQLQKFNSYYDDLIQGKILRNLEVVLLRKDAFRTFMKAKGKLGGQNKVPRLANDRSLADDLIQYRMSD